MKCSCKISRNYLYQAVSGALTLGLAVSSAQAVTGVPPYPAAVPLNSLDVATTGFRLDSSISGDRAGTSVSGIGDINGDGFDDVLIGAPSVGSPVNGNSYVVFGRNNLSSVFSSVQSLTGTGFRIVDSANQRLGFSVSGTGDVNGDGIVDLIIGAPYANNNSGVAYVVFGKDSSQGSNFPPLLDVSSLTGTNGFRIQGAAADSYLGLSVSGAGDINGDGMNDLLIGAPNANNNQGIVYVIFGHSTLSPNLPYPAVVDVSLANNMDGSSAVKPVGQTGTGFNGFRIVGENAGSRFGFAIRSAGNVNNDAFKDIVIGAPNAGFSGNSTGSSYLLFGHNLPFGTNGVVAANQLIGSNGVRFDGAVSGSSSGISVSGGGDINGDGIDDLIIGAPYATNNILSEGSTYVVYGKPQNQAFSSPINLSNLNGTNGFRIDGTNLEESSGAAVSIVKDFNVDGIDDILIGASLNQGRAYLVFGRRITSPVFSLSTLDTLKGIRGFHLDGPSGTSGNVGAAVASAGDINNDGFNDVIVGAPIANPGGVTEAGSSYISYGYDDRIFASGLEQDE